MTYLSPLSKSGIQLLNLPHTGYTPLISRQNANRKKKSTTPAASFYAISINPRHNLVPRNCYSRLLPYRIVKPEATWFMVGYVDVVAYICGELSIEGATTCRQGYQTTAGHKNIRCASQAGERQNSVRCRIDVNIPTHVQSVRGRQ